MYSFRWAGKASGSRISFSRESSDSILSASSWFTWLSFWLANSFSLLALDVENAASGLRDVVCLCRTDAMEGLVAGLKACLVHCDEKALAVAGARRPSDLSDSIVRMMIDCVGEQVQRQR